MIVEDLLIYFDKFTKGVEDHLNSVYPGDPAFDKIYGKKSYLRFLEMLGEQRERLEKLQSEVFDLAAYRRITEGFELIRTFGSRNKFLGEGNYTDLSLCQETVEEADYTQSEYFFMVHGDSKRFSDLEAEKETVLGEAGRAFPECRELVTDAEKGVWGGSGEWDEMKKALQAAEAEREALLALKADRSDYRNAKKYAEGLDNYSFLLSEAARKAEAYVAYKSKKANPKPKEVKRIDAARQIAERFRMLNGRLLTAQERLNIREMGSEVQKQCEEYAERKTAAIAEEIRKSGSEFVSPAAGRLSELLRTARGVRDAKPNDIATRYAKDACATDEVSGSNLRLTYKTAVLSKMLDVARNPSAQRIEMTFEEVGNILGSARWKGGMAVPARLFVANAKKDPSIGLKTKQFFTHAVLGYLNTRPALDSQLVKASVLIDDIMLNDSLSDLRESVPNHHEGKDVLDQMSPEEARVLKGCKELAFLASKGAEASDRLLRAKPGELTAVQRVDLIADVVTFRLINEQMLRFTEAHKKEISGHNPVLNPVFSLAGSLSNPGEAADFLKQRLVFPSSLMKTLTERELTPKETERLCLGDDAQVHKLLGELLRGHERELGLPAETEIVDLDAKEERDYIAEKAARSNVKALPGGEQGAF